MKYENLKKAKKIFLGLEILRMIFAFSIVFFHCSSRILYSYKFYNNLSEFVAIGLTTFFIMAFYFSYDSFISKNINKIKDRFKRLLIPYILWPIIIYLQKAIYNYKHKKKEKLFRILIYQIIIGNGLNMLLWFNLNLIFVLLFFAIAIFINNKYIAYMILIGIQIIFFSFQIIITNFGIDIIVLFTFLLGQ
jgi:surface polysaccharide O-acyltransferase-like enzyme